MRRRLVALVMAALLLGLMLPAVVRASESWNIKDASGRVRGSVDLDGVVRGRGGATVGHLGIRAHLSSPVVKDGRTLAVSTYRTARLATLSPPGSTKVTGRAVRSGDHWVLQKRVNGTFRKVGTAPASARAWDCYNSMALGAARILLW